MDPAVQEFLQKIGQLESSGGKNTEHRTMESGMHAGDTAIGTYGLMPKTVDEVVKRAKLNKEATPEMENLLNMSGEEKKAYLVENPNIERQLAESLASHVLEKQGGDQEKAAYSWLYGHNLTPEKVEQRGYQDEDYVKKFKKLGTSMENNSFRPKAGSPEEEKLKQYLQGIGNAGDLEKKHNEGVNSELDKYMRQMGGETETTFRDSGRKAANPGEVLDSVFGVPARTGIAEMQKGNFDFDMVKKMLGSTATDPKNAPSGVDIAQGSGVTNPYLGAALATAVDVGAQIPGMGMLSKAGIAPGVVGKIARVDDIAPSAPKFDKLKRMFQVGDVSYPADSTAQAMQIKDALEKAGKVKPNRTLTEK